MPSRAWVPNQTVDAGREAGAVQDSMLAAHAHSIVYQQGAMFNPDLNYWFLGNGSTGSADGFVQSYGGVETRPVNVAIPHIIYLGITA